jgi:parallel beta-helix repeat protein
MVIDHKKNTAYELTFPMVDSTTPASFKTGLSPVDTAYYKDGAGAWTTLAITDTAAEIGTTGIYEISLTAAEMNHDWVNIKFTASGAADTLITFKMFTDPITIWHVAKTGSDNNNGHSYEYAKLTIGAAVTASASGDKIIIWPGDYNEQVNTGAKSLIFEGLHISKCSIYYNDADNPALKLTDNCSVSNLKIDNTLGDGLSIQGCVKNRVSNCRISGNNYGINAVDAIGFILQDSHIYGGLSAIYGYVITGFIAERCLFQLLDTITGSTAVSCLVLSESSVINNCRIYARRYTGTGIVKAIEVKAGIAADIGYNAFQNCIIRIDANTTGANYGVYVGNYNRCCFMNCSISMFNGGSGETYNFYNTGYGIVVSGCSYDIAKTYGTIIQCDSGFAAALNAATPASVVGNVGGNVVGSIGSLAVQAQEEVGEITDAIINTNTTIGTIKTDIETTGVVVKDLTTNAKALIQTEAEDAVVAKNLDHFTARTANAQAGGANTITLDTQASSTNDYYNGRTILITAGTGAGQIRRIVSYNGTTKVATVDSSWSLQPVNGSEFLILNLYDAEVTAIKAKTDNLPADPADDSDIDAQLAAIKTDSAAILLDTGTDGVIVNDLTVAAKALIQTEAEDALIAKDLDHIVKTTAGAEKPTDGSYLDKIMNKNVSQTFDDTTDSLEAIRDNQAGADAAAIADAVWDETMTGHIDAGKAGAQIWTDIDAILTDTTAMKATIIKLETTLVMDGAVYQFTANALELAPGGGGDLLGGIVEGTITVKEALSIFLAILSGKSSGGGTATIIFRDTADTKNRLVVTVDAKGNRTAIITRDGT